MTELNPQGDPRLFSPLALAFLGDGVYELLAREYLLSRGNAPVGKLHTHTVELVSATAQAAAYERVAALLTPIPPSAPSTPIPPFTAGPPGWRPYSGGCT